MVPRYVSTRSTGFQRVLPRVRLRSSFSVTSMGNYERRDTQRSVDAFLPICQRRCVGGLDRATGVGSCMQRLTYIPNCIQHSIHCMVYVQEVVRISCSSSIPLLCCPYRACPDYTIHVPSVRTQTPPEHSVYNHTPYHQATGHLGCTIGAYWPPILMHSQASANSSP